MGANTSIEQLDAVNALFPLPAANGGTNPEEEDKRQQDSNTKGVKQKGSGKFSKSKKTPTKLADTKGSSFSATSAAVMRYLSRMSSMSQKSGKVYASSDTETETFCRFDIDARYDSIRFIDFDLFKITGKYPQFDEDGWRPEQRPLDKYFATRASEIDFENSLVIFISHCWVHEQSEPDTSNNDQFNLCVEAVEYIKKTLAPGMKKCYLWIDFSCMKITSDAQTPLRPSSVVAPPLDLIMGCCDCMLTPLYDPDENWKPKAPIKDFFEDCTATPWKGTDHSYLSRAWCRIEMLYCSNVPILKDISSENARRPHFDGVMTDFINRYQRPHIIYANYLQRNAQPPVLLSSLPNSKTLLFHPSSGRVSHGADKMVITKLMNLLQTYVNDAKKVGYDGEVNSAGKMHGHGTFRYESGNVYTGQWEDGLFHGKGNLSYAHNGSTVECEFEHGHEKDMCTCTYSNGDKYYGPMYNGQRIGRGVMEYANGDHFDGLFKADKRNGEGYFTSFETGERYEGAFKEDKRHGKGTLHSADGSILYKGMWRFDERKQRRNSV